MLLSHLYSLMPENEEQRMLLPKLTVQINATLSKTVFLQVRRKTKPDCVKRGGVSSLCAIEN